MTYFLPIEYNLQTRITNLSDTGNTNLFFFFFVTIMLLLDKSIITAQKISNENGKLTAAETKAPD